MKRRLAIIVPVVVALVALGAVLATRPTPSAHARGDGWTLVSVPPNLNGFCSFGVDLTVLTNQEYSKSETQPDGTVVIQITGALKLAMANHDTGKTIDYNESGPGTITISPDGSTLDDGQGSSVFPFPPAAQQQFGVPALAYITGHSTIAFDPNGNVTSLSHDGATISDVCAALS